MLAGCCHRSTPRRLVLALGIVRAAGVCCWNGVLALVGRSSSLRATLFHAGATKSLRARQRQRRKSRRQWQQFNDTEAFSQGRASALTVSSFRSRPLHLPRFPSPAPRMLPSFCALVAAPSVSLPAAFVHRLTGERSGEFWGLAALSTARICRYLQPPPSFFVPLFPHGPQISSASSVSALELCKELVRFRPSSLTRYCS